MKRCWMLCIFRISGWKLKGLIANCLYCLCKVGDMSSFENGCGGLRKLEMYKMKKLLEKNKININAVDFADFKCKMIEIYSAD